MPVLCSSIAPEELPQTFSNAVLTCRRLHLRYLWIDSLCILQSGPGSAEDWQAHVASMHTIYANCVLNIAAVGASNPHQGSFVDRDPRVMRSISVYTPVEKKFSMSALRSPVSTHEERSSSHTAGQGYLVTIFDIDRDFSTYADQQPLSKRAWVFQERLLSPRVLSFGKDRVYWQCNERSLNEYLPTALPGWDNGYEPITTSYFNPPIEVLQSQALSNERRRAVLRVWYDIVKEYSDRALKHPTKDKLAAVAAIAKRFASVFKSKYCAGLFECDIVVGLSWRSVHFQREEWHAERIYSNRTIDVYLVPTRSPEHRAPTWSWASVDGQVFHDNYKVDDSHLVAQVQRVTVELENPDDPFGQVTAGQLIIRGPTFRAEPAHTESPGSCEVAAAGGISGRQDLLALALVRTEGELLVGILLAHVSGDVYQRRGFFKLRNKDSGEPDSFLSILCEEKTVSII